MMRLPVIFVCVALPFFTLARAVHADGAWLDAILANWNMAGAAVPRAPSVDGNTDPRCGQQARDPETAEDDMVVAAGWTLFNTYEAGYHIKLIDGLAGYDGMCRPLGFQTFVFKDGYFAGTLAPMAMDSRTDGVLSASRLGSNQQITATFQRYTRSDPLCCPSRHSAVTYRIDTVDGYPLLVPEKVTTEPNG